MAASPRTQVTVSLDICRLLWYIEHLKKFELLHKNFASITVLWYTVSVLVLWEDSSGSESVELLVRRVENSTSGWVSLWERSPVGSRFSKSLFRDVPGTVPQSVRTCGLKRNSSNLDRAPKMRDFVRLNSWDSFLVTLPLISSETCVMYSSVIPGTTVICDWLFLVCSCVSLETTANFRLFLNVAICCGKVFDSSEDWISCKFYSIWRMTKSADFT